MQNAGKHRRTKQLRIKDLKIREYVAKNGVTVKSVASKDNVADMFTKSLPVEQFRRLRAQLGVRASDAAATDNPSERNQESG
ncbi:hypothetical protein PHMEG_00020008 [Phytophthora megakarya]|uniref:Uncharacterized protein n=1 Tax=Phytophthora megakarya TaxID=4795 RepID=A0A225VPW2_9STRA|nr:hypothetical protein PHMEG_00020008 [Phytophthora megakarya]